MLDRPCWTGANPVAVATRPRERRAVVFMVGLLFLDNARL